MTIWDIQLLVLYPVRYIIFSPFSFPSLSSCSPIPSLKRGSRDVTPGKYLDFCFAQLRAYTWVTWRSHGYICSRWGISCRPSLSQACLVLIKHSLDCRHLNKPPSEAHRSDLLCVTNSYIRLSFLHWWITWYRPISLLHTSDACTIA